MKIGSHMPPWRVPSLVNGTLAFSSLAHIKGRPLVLCCTSWFTLTHTSLLQAHHDCFHDRHATLAVFLWGNTGHDLGRIFPYVNVPFPVLIDPFQRLSRSLHLSRNHSQERCETLFFDQHDRLEFRLIHDLTGKGLSQVLEIMECHFPKVTPPQPTRTGRDSYICQSHGGQVRIPASPQLPT